MTIPFLNNPIHSLLVRLTSGEQRAIVGLAGLPGSGKSTIAARLAAEVNDLAGPNAIMALGMDGFHLTKAELRQMPDPEAALRRRGAPWTFDVAALAASLRAVREAAGQDTVAWPDFQHGIGDPVEGAHVIGPETRLILVEGLYLLHAADGWDEVSSQFDERWYLDTPFELAMTRLADRHMASWGMTREDAERKIAINDWLNAKIVAESRSNADWLLAG